MGRHLSERTKARRVRNLLFQIKPWLKPKRGRPKRTLVPMHYVGRIRGSKARDDRWTQDKEGRIWQVMERDAHDGHRWIAFREPDQSISIEPRQAVIVRWSRKELVAMIRRLGPDIKAHYRISGTPYVSRKDTSYSV